MLLQLFSKEMDESESKKKGGLEDGTGVIVISDYNFTMPGQYFPHATVPVVSLSFPFFGYLIVIGSFNKLFWSRAVDPDRIDPHLFSLLDPDHFPSWIRIRIRILYLPYADPNPGGNILSKKSEEMQGN